MDICNICLKNDILCSVCEGNVKAGNISKSELTILKEASKTGVSIIKMVENNSMVVIIVDKGFSKPLIGKNGEIVKNFQNLLGKRVKILEQDDEKKMIENMLMVPIIGTNIIYSGDEKYRIRIEKTLRSKVHEDRLENLEKILNKKFLVSYE